MGKRTGKPRGRPAGFRLKQTRDREQRVMDAAAVLEKVLPQAFKGDAHALLMSVYKDETLTLEVRLDAAKASIPYEKPRLAAVEHSADKNSNFAMAILTAVPQPDDVDETGDNDDGISGTTH
jgi:hypothetical protein